MMELKEFVKLIFTDLGEAIDELRSEGIMCANPRIIEIDIGVMAYEKWEEYEAAICVEHHSGDRVRLTIPYHRPATKDEPCSCYDT